MYPVMARLPQNTLHSACKISHRAIRPNQTIIETPVPRQEINLPTLLPHNLFLRIKRHRRMDFIYVMDFWDQLGANPCYWIIHQYIG